MAGLTRRLNKLVVGRRVVVRNLSQRRRARVNYKRQSGNQNQQQEEGAQEAPQQHPLDDRDFEAWLEEFYRLYKLSKFRRRVRDAEKPEEKKKAEESSLADGYTHLSKTWRQQRNQGETLSTTPMAAPDHTGPATNGRILPTRDNKFEVVMSLIAALMFVMAGCLVLSFSSPEVNGPLFAPIVCLFTAGYVVLILYDITSRSLACNCDDVR